MLSRKSRIWTDDEDAELLALKKQGLSVLRISVRLKRTSRAINVRLSFLQSRPARFRAALESVSSPVSAHDK